MKLAQTFAAAALMATMAQDVSAQVITADVNPPAGYTRAECIQGDGRTCDVETDFIPNPQTDRFVFEVEFTEVSHNMFVFCARRAAKDASWSLNVQAGYKLRFDYSSQQIQDTTAYEPNVRYACEVASNVLSYASSEGSRTLTATADPSFTEAGSALHLFCAPGNSASIGDFKLYSFKIYRNNALIHDLVPALNALGLKTLMPKGAFYLFPDIRSTGLSSQEFALRLLNEHAVACVPGSAFGPCGEGFVRMSYATSMEQIEVAAVRITEFVKSLSRGKFKKGRPS